MGYFGLIALEDEWSAFFGRRVDRVMEATGQVTGLRHKLVHDYFAVDLDVVWSTATLDVPAIRPVVRGLLEQVDRAPDGRQRWAHSLGPSRCPSVSRQVPPSSAPTAQNEHHDSGESGCVRPGPEFDT